MTLYTQWTTMALMFSSGLLLGVILDTYRVLKARFRLRGWVVSLIDLLYWTVSAGLVFSLLMWSNWGQLRFYIFVAVCMGFFLYYHWVSKQMIRLIQLIIKVIEKLVHWTLLALRALIWIPLVTLWAFLENMFQFLFKILLILAKAFLKCLAPLEWIARPFKKYIQKGTGPFIQKFHQICRRWKTWLFKNREKGE
ncbi:spore cortex biosynthesis protein YabQ [Paenactinomyces guangxiensis]|uniref:Spore cortex biosynthesis protein YabQ n=1 Tax=Paenactinomyces guangxiensis TaxID=1490290 RepID=A0A7W1WTK1_9BACL|nr:spore cortex biosynthesis protein YabQ [Paenactinomyces guangxiensis]MBA4495810.1 spore cortex biosynthesis protein YabQ [Paenactinomyces guangxiensis]MBH8592900.1 spore cortex biosynthesis protein YabQ [Paenactinomyces guangxiensis]